MRVIPRVPGLARLAVGEFGRHRLAHDEAAEGLQAAHDPRRMRRHVVREDARAHARRDAARGDDVLHADGDAEQREVGEDAAGPLLGLGHGARCVEPFPRLDARLEGGDARGARLDQLLHGGAAFAVRAKHVGQAEAEEIHFGVFMLAAASKKRQTAILPTGGGAG
jgi:hypothetical protein